MDGRIRCETAIFHPYTEDCVQPGAIFYPYGRKNGWQKRYLPSIWTEDCMSRHYFPSAETEA